MMIKRLKKVIHISSKRKKAFRKKENKRTEIKEIKGDSRNKKRKERNIASVKRGRRKE